MISTYTYVPAQVQANIEKPVERVVFGSLASAGTKQGYLNIFEKKIGEKRGFFTSLTEDKKTKIV